jgi:hypothetical protein
VAGSGDLLASDFVAKKASASVAGSGDIKCHATDFLKVRTSGSRRKAERHCRGRFGRRGTEKRTEDG